MLSLREQLHDDRRTIDSETRHPSTSSDGFLDYRVRLFPLQSPFII
jgi:hypothetical protein